MKLYISLIGLCLNTCLLHSSRRDTYKEYESIPPLFLLSKFMNTIKEFTHPDLGIRFDVKNIVLSTFLLALGLGLLYYALNFEFQGENSAATLLGLGVGSIIAAVVCYFVGGKSLYFLPTMSKVAFKSWHFDADQLANLKQIVVAGKFDAGMPLPKEIGNVRMDALLAEDNTFGAIQLYKYVDLMYEPQMEVRVLNISEVETLTQILKK